MTLFEREDWTLFRSLATLGQKAGVDAARIPRLVVKELVDNALDAAGQCRVGLADDGDGLKGVFVEDAGEGLPGTDDQVAALFSIARPLVSSKLLRLPTRGALGNGLRVVAGAVLATGGRLGVSTGGRTLRLRPQDTGETVAEVVAAHDHPGTRVEVFLGPALKVDEDALTWGLEAIRFTQGATYGGKTSPFWYDSDAFFELLQAAGDRPVREVVAEFDGCSGPKAGQIATAFKGRAASSLTRSEAADLLTAARRLAKPVNPTRLGAVGDFWGGKSYATTTGTFEVKAARGDIDAVIPFRVEAWAGLGENGESRPPFMVFVNKSPITAEVEAYYSKGDLSLFGCGLTHCIPVGRSAPEVWLNVIAPYMPLTTDGKAPDLRPLVEHIGEVVKKATDRAKRDRRATGLRQRTQKDMVFDAIPQGAAILGEGGRYRFSQRHLLYVIRPAIKPELGRDIEWETFTKIVTDYEDGVGPIPGMYRDPRGVVYHPHLREEIPLGTLAVEEYRRPEWVFNKVLYVEKEGFFPLLKDLQWPERHDCALLTSKGQATRAAKDLIDLLGETDEELTFFAIHDADAPGTMIYQALQEATRARPARRVKIINLGLDPWEATTGRPRPGHSAGEDFDDLDYWEPGLNLPFEPITYKTRQPVGSYVPKHWANWLQKNRVELNAMTPRAFAAWLDAKVAKYDRGKVIPSQVTLFGELIDQVEKELTDRLTKKILTEADLDGQVKAAEAFLTEDQANVALGIEDRVAGLLTDNPVESWREPVKRLAVGLVEKHAADLFGEGL